MDLYDTFKNYTINKLNNNEYNMESKFFPTNRTIIKAFKDVDLLRLSKQELIYINRLFDRNYLFQKVSETCGREVFYKFIVPEYSIELERNVFLKLMICAELSKEYDVKEILGFSVNSGYVLKNFKNVSSNYLRNDSSFALITCLINGKYFSAFDDNIRNSKELSYFAIINDKDLIPKSFHNTSLDFRSDYNNGLLYIKKLNEHYNVSRIYDELFAHDDNFNYKDNNFTKFNPKDEVLQKEWLSNYEFLAGLTLINNEFSDYVTSSKIVKYGIKKR